MEVIHTIGRRKTAVARIYLKAGNGTITVNKRELNNYFTTPTLQYKVKQALTLVGAEDAYDVKVNVYGGGITGQAEAVRLAIARALCELNAENRTEYLIVKGKELKMNIYSYLLPLISYLKKQFAP